MNTLLRSSCRCLAFTGKSYVHKQLEGRAIQSCRAFSVSSTTPDTSSDNLIQLSRRMSELDMCSRREATAYISRNQVLVRGVPAVIGQKVDPVEKNITMASPKLAEELSMQYYDAIVLNKPRGFVSAQPEEGKVPAVRLLTPANQDFDGEVDDKLSELKFRRGRSSNGTKETTLSGYAPAGRLDQDSSGLIVFCKSGILAKKLVSAEGLIEKEYIVEVETAKKVMEDERKLGLTALPKPTLDLSTIQKGGARLVGDSNPLKKASAEWLREGQVLRIVLKEGKNRQIRRMVRELLGYHVVRLYRTRIGPIKLGQLPERKWRQLRRDEVDAILATKR